MTDNTENETTDDEVVDTEETTEEEVIGTETEEEQDTFPREYVEDLRKENAGYRDRAKQADALAARLHTALVAATGRLADASDLAFDPSHLDDEAALTAAVDALLAAKPHLASRRVTGDIGQGAGASSSSVDLAGLLRMGA